MKPTKKQLGIGSVIAALPLAYGMVEFTDKRYVQASNNERLERRVVRNEITYLYHQALSNYYFLLDQSNKYPDNKEIKHKLDEAKRKVEELEKKKASS